MAILVNKDTGYGDTSRVYLKIVPFYTPINGGEWQIQIEVFLSKRAKEIHLIQKWIRLRADQVLVQVPFDQAVSKKLGIGEDIWEQTTIHGPWDTAEEFEHLQKTYMQIAVTPIQKYEHYFYNRENAIGISEISTIEEIYAKVYATIKNPDSQMFGIIESPQFSKADTIKSIDDDLESNADVITRIALTDSAVGKLGPGEEKLQIPTIWEHGWR